MALENSTAKLLYSGFLANFLMTSSARAIAAAATSESVLNLLRVKGSTVSERGRKGEQLVSNSTRLK